jgi:ribosome-associated toxin RatA of RatAB toxin-antitoxin module
MKTINHTANLPFSAEQMYALVNDIESYPAFLPWCKNAKITDRTSNEIQATMTVAVAKFEKTFETRNMLVVNDSIQLKLVNGPFKFFEGLWSFKAINNENCVVSYTMSFEFKSRLISVIAEPIFAAIADSMINAFKTRAEELYS